MQIESCIIYILRQRFCFIFFTKFAKTSKRKDKCSHKALMRAYSTPGTGSIYRHGVGWYYIFPFRRLAMPRKEYAVNMSRAFLFLNQSNRRLRGQTRQ